ncbi:MAG: transcriptional repressor [Bdellovibrionota bacterium]
MTTKQALQQLQQKRVHLHQVFEKYLEKLNLRQTRQRKIILDAVLGAPRHVDAETVAKEAKKIDSSIGLATVYRTLKMMTDAKILVERHFSDTRACFEFADENVHHDHLICNQCGEIIEFLNEEIERKQEEITQKLGFVLTSHKMELFADCMNKANCKKMGKKVNDT